MCVYLSYQSSEFVFEVGFQEAAQEHPDWLLIGRASKLASRRFFVWPTHLSYELLLQGRA